MRLWNLSEYSDLETSVVQSYGATAGTKRRAGPDYRPSRFKIALSVAALATSFSIGIVQANASTVNLPLSAVSVAQSTPELGTPLAGYFQGRFGADWTEEMENELLMRVEINRLQGSSISLTDQTIDVVFSNQLEDLSDPNRMSRDQIAALLKSRKL